jgi:hypothetical protein
LRTDCWFVAFFFFNLLKQCLCENIIRKLVPSSRGNSESFTNKPKILIDYKEGFVPPEPLNLRGNYTIKISLSMQTLSHFLIITISCLLRQTVFRKTHSPLLTLSHYPLLSPDLCNLEPLFLPIG